MVTSLFLKVLECDQDEFGDQFHPPSALATCKLYNTFLHKSGEIDKNSYVAIGITNGVAFNARIITKLWKFIESFCQVEMMSDPDLRLSNEYDGFSHTISIFAIAYKHLLSISDEEDFFQRFTEQRLAHMTMFLISIAQSHLLNPNPERHVAVMLTNVCQLLGILFEFNTRYHYVNERAWLLPYDKIDYLMVQFFNMNFGPVQELLRQLPQVIPFENRVEILKFYIELDKEQNHGVVRDFTIRRQHIFEDAMELIPRVQNMKSRLMVVFMNEFNEQEMGIDAGGLFKEFWTTLAGEAFNPSYGLFKLTED
jgi:ubiquitin-protein ligase E3 C